MGKKNKNIMKLGKNSILINHTIIFQKKKNLSKSRILINKSMLVLIMEEDENST